MYCEKCGAKISDDARFCYKCGSAIRPELTNSYVASKEPSLQQHSENNISTTSLSENETVEAICPHCGFNGRMQIIEKNSISQGGIILLYIMCYGALFVVACIADRIFVPIFPTWVLYIVGFIIAAIATKGINNYIKGLQVKRIICPNCKQVLEFRQK